MKIPQDYEGVAPFALGHDSEVFLVKRKDDGQKFLFKTLKQLKPTESRETIDLKLRFKNEVDIASTLHHPNIAKIHRSFSQEGSFSLIYPYKEGQTLAKILEEGRPVPHSTVVALISQLLSALDYIHSKGIVHCDVNPNNIYVSRNNHLEIFDFGFSLVERKPRASESHVLGTIPYLAPEQTGYTHFKIDHRTDLFCAAIILYRLFAGKLPFQSRDDLKEYMEQLLQVEPEPVRDLSMAFNQILFKSLAPNPDERYQTAEGFRHDLQTAQTQGEGNGRPMALGEKDRILAATRKRFFIGRDHQVHSLNEGFRSLQSGKGSSYLIYGISGIGKTEIVREFLRGLPPEVLTINIKCNEFSASQPFSVVRTAIFEALAHVGNTGEVEALRKALSGSLAEHSGVLCKNVKELIPFFEEIHEDVAVEREQDRLIHVLHLLLLEFARRYKMVLHVDDIQWMDKTSYSVLKKCLNPPYQDGLNFQLIFNFRTRKTQEEPYLHAQSLLKLNLHKVMPVTPFSHRDIKAYIKHSFDAVEREDELVRTLALKTDNTPFSLSESLKLLVRENVITYGASGWSFDAEGWISRVNRLEPANLIERKFELAGQGEQEYLKLASLFGGKFDPGILLELSGLPKDRADSYLDSLERMGFVAAGFRNEYQFTHDQVHEVISRSISKEKSRSLNEKIGDLFFKKSKRKRRAMLSAAEHYLKSGNPYKSMETCVAAARYAREKMGHDLAVRYYQMCLLLEQTPDSTNIPEGYDRIQTRLDLADLFILMGKNNEALTLVSPVLNEKVDKKTLVRAYYTMGLVHSNLADMEKACEVYEKALELLGVSLPKHKASLFVGLAWNFLMLFVPRFPLLGKKGNRDKDLREKLRIMNKLCYASFFFDVPRAFYTTFKSQSLAKRIAPCPEQAECYVYHGVFLFFIFFKERALKHASRSINIANLLKQKDLMGLTKCFSGMIYLYNAQWEKADKCFSASTDFYKSIGDSWGQLFSRTHKGMLYFYRGNLQKLSPQLGEAKGMFEGCPDKHSLYHLKFLEIVLNALREKNIDTKKILNTLSELRKSESLLTVLECSGYASQALTQQGKLQESYSVITQAASSAIENLMLQEYVTPVFHQLCEVIVQEKLNRLDEKPRLACKQEELEKYWKTGLRELVKRSLACPANRGGLSRYRAWGHFFKGRNRLANYFFRTAIRKHKILDMKYEEAKSRRDYALFLDKVSKPGLARDEYEKAYKLFERCGATLECEKIQDKVAFSQSGRQTPPPQSLLEPSVTLEGASSGVGKLRLDSLSTISQSITSANDLGQLLHQILHTAIEVTQAQKGYLFLPENEHLDSSDLLLNYRGEELDHGEINYSREVLEWVQTEKRIFRLTNTENSPVKFKDPEKIKSVLCLPLIHNQNFLGLIYLSHDRIKGMFGEESEKTAKVISTQASILLENAQHIQKHRDLNKNLEKKVQEQTKSIRDKSLRLEDARLRLIESERMRSLLTGTLVHDIKNYLSGVEGNLRILIRKYKEDPKGLRNIMAATEACHDIMSMTSNLLDVGKMEEGRLELKRQKIQLTEIVELVKKVQGTFDTSENKLKYTVQVSAESKTVYWDPDLLHRVLQNLLNNANKYTPAGGEIKVELEPGSAEAVLTVFNSGNPLDESIKEKVFEKYSRTDGKWSQYSKGMGLYFCKMVVEAHGSRIWVDTNSAGNYFRFSLPYPQPATAKESSLSIKESQ